MDKLNKLEYFVLGKPVQLKVMQHSSFWDYTWIKNEMKWNEMKWNEMKWNEMKWNEMKWNEMKWNENITKKMKVLSVWPQMHRVDAKKLTLWHSAQRHSA